MKRVCKYACLILLLMFAAQYVFAQQTEIKIDGDTADWAGYNLIWEKKLNAFYCITNSKDYVYVLMKITGKQEQMKALNAGIELWFNNNDKKKKISGLKFPLPGETASFSPMDMPHNDDEMQQRMQLIITQKNTLEITGFKKEFNGVKTLSPGNAFDADIALNNGALVYEARIPLAAFENNNSKNLLAGIFINALKMPDMGGGFPGGGMPPGGPPEGMPGGGMNSGDMQDIFRISSVWASYTIK